MQLPIRPTALYGVTFLNSQGSVYNTNYTDMGNTILTAYAKINLSLNVLPRRGSGGYFEVRFVNAQVTLGDRVRISDTTLPGIHMEQQLVDRSENIALRAARLVCERHGITGGIDIDIEKRIPLRAGLGGGSADAASVINGLDRHFRLGITDGEKNEIARKLGMDVCYCVQGGLCTVSGVGERVDPLHLAGPELEILIATPAERKPSTAWAYSLLQPGEMGKQLDRMQRLLRGLAQGDARDVAENLHNDFQAPVGMHYPVTENLREQMISGGALGAQLAGSGLSVFGVFSGTGDLMGTKKRLEGQGYTCFAVRMLGEVPRKP
jgi:4-diphosphocytidyl-2-C-methyl-D-erythritol kinase